MNSRSLINKIILLFFFVSTKMILTDSHANQLVHSPKTNSELCKILEKRSKERRAPRNHEIELDTGKISYDVTDFMRLGVIRIDNINHPENCSKNQITSSDLFIYPIVRAFINGDVDFQIKAMKLSSQSQYPEQIFEANLLTNSLTDLISHEHYVNIPSIIKIKDRNLTIFNIEFLMRDEEIEEITTRYPEYDAEGLRHGVDGFTDDILGVSIQAKQNSEGLWYLVPYSNYDMSLQSMFSNEPWLNERL